MLKKIIVVCTRMCAESVTIYYFWMIRGGLSLDDCTIRVVMYADGVVLFVTDPKALQGMIDKLA